MFVFNRSAAAVLVPLALLAVVAWWSSRGPDTALEAARDTPAEQVHVAQAEMAPLEGG